MAAFLITIPHAGEIIPLQATWLKDLPEQVLMCDADRYVDQLYLPVIAELKISSVVAEFHRYCGDLNRLPEDIDASTVEGSAHPAGKFPRGFIWGITTTKLSLLTKPISQQVYAELVDLIHKPFHQKISRYSKNLKEKYASQVLYHLDLHSMPSKGTSEHRDPGEMRADIVISDQQGKSASKKFLDLVVQSYQSVGFKVALNWPYYGGRITEQYGKPAQGHETIQVELNRALYMDEVSKQKSGQFMATQGQLSQAIRCVSEKLSLF